MNLSVEVGKAVIIDERDFQHLFDALSSLGYGVVGPTVRGGAVVYERIESVEGLPAGWGDEQDGGRYRLKKREDGALFGYAAGPHSWKKFLYPPTLKLWQVGRGALEIGGEAEEPEKLAFLGVRACDLEAIAVLDRTLLGGPYVDSAYRSRRDRALIIAVSCGFPGGTCFCASMGTGPRVAGGYDLALTELAEPGRHRFLIEVGSALGADPIRKVPHRPAGDEDLGTAEEVVSRAARRMGRAMETSGIKDLLYENYEHPRWDDVVLRCLTCGNCAIVCPTCFCATVEDGADLAGETAERRRRWDVCFTLDFSYIHGGSVRSSARARYRQWMTHKLATWIDQFGVSGCVGCGRCITWCPVGIDITEEVRAIRGGKPAGAAAASVKEARDADA